MIAGLFLDSMSVRERDNPALYTRIQEQNLLRQYDLLSNCVEIALDNGIESFDKYTLWALNYAAVANIAQFGGRYREEPILVGNHIPPHFKEVPQLMDRFFSLIHENWTLVDHLQPAARKAGISGQIGFHTLRRTLASVLVANGTDPKLVQELLRHSNVKTTLDIYARAITPAKLQAQGWVLQQLLPAETKCLAALATQERSDPAIVGHNP